MTSILSNASGARQNGTTDARTPLGGDHYTSTGNLTRERGFWGTTYALDPWRAVHIRLRRDRGPASAYPCAEAGCDRRGREWALTVIDSSMQWGHTPNGHRAPYSDDLGNYTPRCARHARALDRQQAAERRDGLAITPRDARPRALPAVRTAAVQAPQPEALFDLDGWTMGGGR